MPFNLLNGPSGPTFGAPNTGGGGTAPVIAYPLSLATGTISTVYPTTTFTATGSPTIVWSVTAGSSVLTTAGLTFSSGGVLSGTCAATTTGFVTFRATNAYGYNEITLSLTIAGAATPGAFDNSLTLALPTSTTTNYPYQFGRRFSQGDITNYPQVLIDGAAQTTQADVKNRWPDGSVKFAVISVVVPALSMTSKTLTFQNQLTGNNTATTVATMLGGAFDFNCTITATSGGSALTGAPVSARTMLSAISDATLASNTSSDSPNSRYWTQGSVCTTVILVDHTTKAYDFGTTIYKSLRPIFHVQFWPTLNKYKVRVIVEGADVTKLHDQAYDVSLSIGNASPTTVYSRAAVPQHLASRWTKSFWSGAAPVPVNEVHNAEYLSDIKAIPYYDPANITPEAKIVSQAAAWNSLTTVFGDTPAGKDIYDPGYYTKNMQAPGGRSEIALFSDWHIAWLQSGDYRLKVISDAHAELALAWPMHLREGSSSKFYDAAQTLPAIGCPTTLFARPTTQTGDGNFALGGYVNGVWGATPADAHIFIARGAPPSPGTYQGNLGAILTNNNGWSPYSDHVPQPFYINYITSGEYIWLEQAHFWASWSLLEPQVNTTAGFYGRGPTITSANFYGDIRRAAWLIRNRVSAAAVAVDVSKEKTYYDYAVNNGIAIHEGLYGVTATANVGTAPYVWGATVARPDGNYFGALGLSPLHHQNHGTGYAYGYESVDPLEVGAQNATFQSGYYLISTSFAKDQGFAIDGLRGYVAEHFTTCIDGGPTSYLHGVMPIPCQYGSYPLTQQFYLIKGGSGYASAPTVTIAAPGGGGTQATATATISSGVVNSLTITNGGSGYSSAPSVTISAPGGTGRLATAIATVSGGIVTGLTISCGSGYTSPPTVIMPAPNGPNPVQATATATINAAGEVTGITATNIGDGYRNAETAYWLLGFSGGGGVGAAASAYSGPLTRTGWITSWADTLAQYEDPDAPRIKSEATIASFYGSNSVNTAAVATAIDLPGASVSYNWMKTTWVDTRPAPDAFSGAYFPWAPGWAMLPRIPITANPRITTTALPPAVATQAYSFQLKAKSTLNSYTWTASSALPAWLSLSSSGLLTGTPALGQETAGVGLTFVCSNGNAPAATITLTLVVQSSRPQIVMSSVTRQYFNSTASVLWNSWGAGGSTFGGGDWWDATATANGTAPWAVGSENPVADTDTVKAITFDITTLMQKVYANPSKLSAIIICGTGSGTATSYALKDNLNSARRPTLSYNGGAAQQVVANTALDYSSFGGGYNAQSRNVSPGLTSGTNWQRIIIDLPPPSTSPVSAILTLWTDAQFGAVGANVFWLRNPPESAPTI